MMLPDDVLNEAEALAMHVTGRFNDDLRQSAGSYLTDARSAPCSVFGGWLWCLGSGYSSSVWELSDPDYVLRVQHAAANEPTKALFTALSRTEAKHLPKVYAAFEVAGFPCFVVRRYVALEYGHAGAVADGLWRALYSKRYGTSGVPGKLVRAYRRALVLAAAVEGRFTRAKLLHTKVRPDAHGGNLMRDPATGMLIIIDPVI